MRVQISTLLQKRAAKLPPDVRNSASAAIAFVAEAFGQPHLHGGLRLRKLGKRSYEVRVQLQWRETLTAYDLMSHDEVRRWVRNQTK